MSLDHGMIVTGGGAEAPDADPPSPSPRFDLMGWILREAPHTPPDELMDAFAGALHAAGLPVDRVMVAVESMHSTALGFSRVWTRGGGVRETPFPHGSQDQDLYRRSPFQQAHTTERWVEVDLADPDGDTFDVVGELRAEGFRHYLCIPIRFADGRHNGLSLAMRDPGGFTASMRATLERVMPAFATVLELSVERWRLQRTLGTYVGRTPARRILSGRVQRGAIERIEAAIMFVDMRDYTATTADLAPEETVELLDAFFDCLVPSIRGHRGEILKYMGDGLLAAFHIDPEAPETSAGPDDAEIGSSRTAERAVVGALGAAHASLHAIEMLNARSEMAALGRRELRAGFALHFGEAAYGNVGAEDRLDFTVVGRDVNLASRIARLNRTLDEPILLSERAARILGRGVEPIGEECVPGLDEPVAVYRPS